MARSLSGLGAPSRGRPPSSRLPRSFRAHSADYVSGRISASCRCGSAAAGEPKSDRLLALPLDAALDSHAARETLDRAARSRLRDVLAPQRLPLCRLATEFLAIAG